MSLLQEQNVVGRKYIFNIDMKGGVLDVTRTAAGVERKKRESHSDQTKEKEFHCERREKRDLMSFEIRCCIPLFRRGLLRSGLSCLTRPGTLLVNFLATSVGFFRILTAAKKSTSCLGERGPLVWVKQSGSDSSFAA